VPSTLLRRRGAAQIGVIRRRLENEALPEKRFPYVAQATNDTIWDWNLLTDTLWRSDGPRTIFGNPPEEAASDAILRWGRLHPDDHKRVEE